MYRIVWMFDVRSGNAAEFERVYGPEGEWARLFRNGVGYQGSDLLRDVAREYRALDERCERLTSDEQRIGEFEEGEGES